MTRKAWNFLVGPREGECTLLFVVKDKQGPLRRCMTRRTVGSASDSELSGMRIVMARLACRRGIPIDNNPALPIRLMTPRAGDGGVLSGQSEGCRRVVKRHCLPVVRRMTAAARRSPEILELPVMLVLVAGLACHLCKPEDRSVTGRRIMAPCTNNGRMSAFQGEPGFVMTCESEGGGFVATHCMAPCAVIVVFHEEVALMVVCMAVCALVVSHLHESPARHPGLRLVAAVAFDVGVLAAKLEACAIVVELLPGHLVPACGHVTRRAGLRGEAGGVRRGMARGTISESPGGKRHGADLSRWGRLRVAFVARDITVFSHERESVLCMIERRSRLPG